MNGFWLKRYSLLALLVVLGSLGTIGYLANNISRIEAALPLASLHKERDFSVLLLDIARLESALQAASLAPDEERLERAGFALDLVFLRLRDNRALYTDLDAGGDALHKELTADLQALEAALRARPVEVARLEAGLEHIRAAYATLQTMNDSFFQASMVQISEQREYLAGLRDSMAALIALAGLVGLFLLVLLFRLQRSLDEQQRQAGELRNREEKLSALFVLSPLGIALTDMQGRYLEFNDAFCRICDRTPEQLGALDYWTLTPPEYRKQEAQQLESLERTGKYGPYEKEYRRQDGSLVPVRLNGMLVQGSDGRRYIWSIVEDISERRRAEGALHHAKEAAEAANVAKSRFLATMSHEIRTPMNGILGMAQLLMMPGLTEDERHEYARTILGSGQTLLTLLNDILDLSKVEAGKLELVQTAFDPELVIAESAALFGEPAQAKGLMLEACWRGPPGRYRADPTRLRQMLANLVSNAVKFTAQGYVRVEGREVERDADGALLEFSVSDSGIGILPEQQSLLFKPFSQADSSTTREYGGTGLGLSIVRSLAWLMGGEAGVESVPGRSARFWFRIRAGVLTTDGEEQAVEQHAAGAPPLAGRVLVVEDNATNRMVVQAMLSKLGLEFTSVENGRQALAVTMSEPRPDLVLMDVQMPVMDGIEAAGRIRAWERDNGLAHLPIVALTASAYADDRRRCIDAGMDDFLAKPVRIDDLAAVLGRWRPAAADRRTVPPAPGFSP